MRLELNADYARQTNEVSQVMSRGGCGCRFGFAARGAKIALPLLLLALALRGDVVPASPATKADCRDQAELIGLLVDPELGDVAAAALPPVKLDPELATEPLSEQQQALSKRVRQALGIYYHRHLNSRDHNPWEMMHAIIAYGPHTIIRRGGPDGQQVDAIKYVADNGACHGIQLLFIDRGRVNARKGPYVQGHYAQLLAILAQSRVGLDTPLKVENKRFVLRDLLETEKWTCDEGMELTFKLISVAHYCDSDTKWRNFKGQTWGIPRLIKEELASPILSNAACGGTHRLTALAYAVKNRQREGKPIDGEWLRAKKYLADYHRYTLALQNNDGSFSTEWFRRKEAKPDLDRRIQTTGHILEWLVYSLPANQLDHPQVIKAVNYLTTIMLREPSRKWEIGPLGHAVHALAIYDARRYRPLDHPVEVARRFEFGKKKRAADQNPAAEAPAGPSRLSQRAGERKRIMPSLTPSAARQADNGQPQPGPNRRMLNQQMRSMMRRQANPTPAGPEAVPGGTAIGPTVEFEDVAPPIKAQGEPVAPADRFKTPAREPGCADWDSPDLRVSPPQADSREDDVLDDGPRLIP